MADLRQIKKHLDKFEFKYKLIDLGLLASSGQVVRVEDVIKAGVNPDEIVKTLIVKTFYPRSSPGLEKGYVALAVRGRDRVDFKKVRRLFGPSTSFTLSVIEVLRVNCELARPEEVEKIVGVPVGAVCPVLIGLPLYFDRKVMVLKRVNLGSGDLTKGLEIDLADLLEVVGKYQVADLVNSKT